MKKSIIIVTSLIIAVLMVLTVKSSFQTGISLVCMIGVFAILFMSYFYFEKSHAGTKEIAIIATLSAFAAISRIIFALIPNVQPVTFLVAISGFVFGPYEGFLIGSTTAFLSDIFWAGSLDSMADVFMGTCWDYFRNIGKKECRDFNS